MVMKKLFFMMLVATLIAVVHAGLAPTYLPESSYYQGRKSFNENLGNGIIVTGHLEFAVYKGTEADEAIAATGYAGDTEYVYAYQVFNDQQSNAALTYFAVTGINPGSVDSDDDIGAMDDSQGGAEPTTQGFNSSLTKGIWEFGNAKIIQGDQSWFLFIYSNYDWIVGDIQLQAVYDDDLPVPIVPEPATLALVLCGAVLSLKRRSTR